MLITYFRSSSYTNWDFCQQQYFLTYNLGIRSPTNLKAAKGTIVHKVMECLAWYKKCKQDGLDYFQDDAIGKVYLADCNINDLVDRAYTHYSSVEKHLTWKSVDLRDCRNWSWKCVREYDGRFDPRKRKIVDPERRFDFVIPYEWAKYSYDTPDGKLEGNLALKGTIDLVTEIAPGVIEIVDWKTGRRLDWGTGAVKDFTKLSHDPQLMLYFYAASLLYPDAKIIILTIVFINDGGPFTVVFHLEDIFRVERMIEKRFKVVQKTIRPRLKKTWRCNSFCFFGKNNYIHPDGTDSGKTICEFFKDKINEKGIDYTVQNYKEKGFSIGYYESPG